MKSKHWVALAVLLLTVARLKAADLSSNDFIEGGKRYDGKEVVYTGEAIGDPMRRGDHWWVNVNDGNNAIGIWLDANQFASIREYGSHRATGDVLRIQGIFHRSCPQHGGDMDIHAGEVVVVKRGASTNHTVRGSTIILAAVLLSTSFAAFILWRKMDRQ